MLYLIPIEPLAERYTQSWYENFPPAFRQQGFDVQVIEGTALTSDVQVGAFLDMNSTVYYKNSQMQEIAKLFHEKKIKDWDMFFFGDLEFWGLESLRLLAQINNVQIKIFGFLHAASYTHEDAFAVAAPYQKYTELGWLAACDKVFVGSEYHKQAVIDRRITPLGADPALADKIVVSGNPMFLSDYQEFPHAQKSPKLIISNRFDWEKRPNLSLDFAYLLKRRHPQVDIVVTTSRPKFRSNRRWLEEYAANLETDGILTIHEGLSKAQYHKHLAESRVMLTNSIEENFGFCIAEALHYNCYPVAKNAYSHPELLRQNPSLLFDDEDEILEKVEQLMFHHTYHVSHYALPYFESLSVICAELRKT